MFGPLPMLHRLVVAALTVVIGVACGAWLAHVTSLPIAVGSGAVLGCLAGALVAFGLVHDFNRPRPSPVPRRR